MCGGGGGGAWGGSVDVDLGVGVGDVGVGGGVGNPKPPPGDWNSGGPGGCAGSTPGVPCIMPRMPERTLALLPRWIRDSQQRMF